jgi:hypothetical protein
MALALLLRSIRASGRATATTRPLARAFPPVSCAATVAARFVASSGDKIKTSNPEPWTQTLSLIILTLNLKTLTPKL